jgi:hypothetical protein
MGNDNPCFWPYQIYEPRYCGLTDLWVSYVQAHLTQPGKKQRTSRSTIFSAAASPPASRTPDRSAGTHKDSSSSSPLTCCPMPWTQTIAVICKPPCPTTNPDYAPQSRIAGSRPGYFLRANEWAATFPQATAVTYSIIACNLQHHRSFAGKRSTACCRSVTRRPLAHLPAL